MSGLVSHRRTALWHRHVGIEEAAACACGPGIAAPWNAYSVSRRGSAGYGFWCAADRLCRWPDRYLVLAAVVGCGSPGIDPPRSARPIRFVNRSAPYESLHGGDGGATSGKDSAQDVVHEVKDIAGAKAAAAGLGSRPAEKSPRPRTM